MYFIVAIISEQELTKDPRLIIPIILILKLIFFFGWLEVAKAIDDPWDGKDYEDFKVATCEIGQNHLLSLSSLHSNWSTLSDPGADIETLLVCGQELAAGERPSDHAENQSYVDFADKEPTANKQLSLIQILTHSCC